MKYRKLILRRLQKRYRGVAQVSKLWGIHRTRIARLCDQLVTERPGIRAHAKRVERKIAFWLGKA